MIVGLPGSMSDVADAFSRLARSCMTVTALRSLCRSSCTDPLVSLSIPVGGLLGPCSIVWTQELQHSISGVSSSGNPL